MPELQDLERALFGARKQGGSMNAANAAVHGDSGPRRRRRERITVDEIEILLNNRAELGHSEGFSQGYDAASESHELTRVREITETVRGTLRAVLADLEPAVARVLAGRDAITAHPRAGASGKLVFDAAGDLEAAYQALLALLAQVDESGISLP